MKLNGKPFQLHPLTPSMMRVIAALDKAPADEVFTTDKMAQLAGVHAKGARESAFTAHTAIQPYQLKVGPVRYWGSKRAIAELRREVGA